MVSCRQAFLLSGLLCGFMLAGLRTPFRQFHHALCHMKVVAPWRRRSLPWHAPHTRHPVFGCQGSDYVSWFGRKKTSGVMISQSVSGRFSLSLNAGESCSPADVLPSSMIAVAIFYKQYHYVRSLCFTVDASMKWPGSFTCYNWYEWFFVYSVILAGSQTSAPA